MRIHRRFTGFSLIELCLAIAVTSFCLLAILGLMTVGFRAGQQARDYTAIAGAASWVNSRIHARTAAGFVLPATVYFDVHGQPVSSNAALYACDVAATTVPEGALSGISTNLRLISMQFTWPASMPAAIRRNTNTLYATEP